jgi:hypothetical protein
MSWQHGAPRGIILIVRRSNLPAPGSNGWSRNHDVKPAESDAASI